MNWFNQYKDSLKNIDAEEPLDIYFFRPMAFVIVKIFYSFPLTPNHYSLFALLSGLIAAAFFAQGTEQSFQWGAFAFLMFAIFDCCDGMVARLKKNGSEFGRVIDGLVDYAVNAAAYVGLAFGIGKLFPQSDAFFPYWALVLAAGFSKAVHAVAFDHFLGEYMSYAQGKPGFAANELAIIKEKLDKAIANNESVLRITGWKVYYAFTSVQAGKDVKPLVYNPESYCRVNQKVIRMWSLIGPAPHMTLLIIAFLAKSPNVFFGYSIVFGNLWLLFMLFYQKQVNAGLGFQQESVI